MEKLHIDFRFASSCVSAMEDNGIGDEPRDLIGALLVQAGATMKDESVDLVSRLPDDPVALERRIAQLAQVSADLGALASAAEALFRKSAD